jgi:hypothetical protein
MPSITTYTSFIFCILFCLFGIFSLISIKIVNEINIETGIYLIIWCLFIGTICALIGFVFGYFCGYCIEYCINIINKKNNEIPISITIS